MSLWLSNLDHGVSLEYYLLYVSRKSKLSPWNEIDNVLDIVLDNTVDNEVDKLVKYNTILERKFII